MVLNGGQYSTLTRSDGKFTFHDVDTGIYLLEVNDIHLAFPQMKVKVDRSTDSISVVEYKFPGASRTQATHPIELMALTKLKYFHDPASLQYYWDDNGQPHDPPHGFLCWYTLPFPEDVGEHGSGGHERVRKAQGEEDPMAAMKKMLGLGDE